MHNSVIEKKSTTDSCVDDLKKTGSSGVISGKSGKHQVTLNQNRQRSQKLSVRLFILEEINEIQLNTLLKAMILVIFKHIPNKY